MEKDRIIIISHDIEYLDGIESKLARAMGQDVEIDLISESTYLERFLEKPKKARLLIVEDGLSALTGNGILSDKMLVLTENDTASDRTINKYDGVSGILKHVDKRLLRDTRAGMSERAQVVHVVGLSGGCGKTTASLGMAYNLSVKGRRVLYFNADLLQNHTREMGVHEDEYAAEEVAIAMGGSGPVQTERLLEQKVHEWFDFFLPFRRMIRTYGLTEARLVEIAYHVATSGQYDDVILEHPYGFTEDTLNALHKADSVVFVGLQDGRTADRFERIMKGNVTDRRICSIICNHFREDCTDELTPAAEREDVSVCEYIPVIEQRVAEEQRIYKAGHFRKAAEIAVLKR